MLKKINWKAIFKGFAWVVCLSGVVVLMSFISVKKQEQKCTIVRILIPGADNFIEREEIDAILKQSQGNLVGRVLKNINIHEIERAILANPYIAFAKVYADMDGVVSIQVKQRQPVLRIINAGGQDYYIDQDGLKMPISSNFTANVLVATGQIFEGFGGRVDSIHSTIVKDLYRTALFVKRDTLWDAQIEQLVVNEKNDIELIPRVGNQRIILGNADSVATKMNNLLAFYKQAMPQVGWDAYKTINVKYINQIICEKNGEDLSPAKSKLPDSLMTTAQLADTVRSVVVKEDVKKEVKNNTLLKVEAPKKESPKAEMPKTATPKPEVLKKETQKNEILKKEMPKKESADSKKITVPKPANAEKKTGAVSTPKTVAPTKEKQTKNK